MMRIISFALPIVLLIGVSLMLGWGVQDTEVVSYTITGVSLDDGLVIEGVLVLNNPSRLPVPITKVTYTVSTDGGDIASGELDGWLLAPGESETNMAITLTSESVLSALRTTDDSITVDGEVHTFLGTIPFSDTYTAQDAVRGAIRSLRDTIGGLV